MRGNMDRSEVFQILGIEFTADERAIRNAYREKLAVTNPEDDQESFMRLRTAYEEACRLAKQLREAGEKAGIEVDGADPAVLAEALKSLEQDQKPRDTTPSGLWLERAQKIYASISLRKDVNSWKELFDDDCFLSLEEEENCRLKLLTFLTAHFRLPTNVWKLLDKRLGIRKDAAFLREHYPADYVRYIINKCDRGEDVDFDQFEGEDDADYDQYLQHYDRCWQAFQEGNPELAREHIESADKLQIRHPIMEICRAELLVRQGSPKEAIELLEALRERCPRDAMVSYNTAEALWKQGEKEPVLRDRAAVIYQELKAENNTHYMANVRLTEWYCDQGSYREAKKCAEKVLSVGSDPSFLELLARVNSHIEEELEVQYRENGGWEPALELCWCYLQDGKVASGIQLALKLEKQIPPEKEAEYNGLLAKLYVEEAEYETSITMTRFWEQELEKKLSAGEDEEEAEKDRDRLRQAHLIRMQCYHNLGFADSKRFTDAIREGESVLTDTIKDVGVLLEMTQIYVEMWEYERCQELVDKLVNEYQIFAAYATSLEAYKRQMNAGGVISSGSRCLQYFPGYVKAYEYMAKVYLDLKRTEDFKKITESAEKNGVKSVLLDAYQYQMERPGLAELNPAEINRRVKQFRKDFLANVEKGQLTFYETGLSVINELLYRFPDSYLLVERGVFHKAAHHYEEAREDYEKALALKPSNPYALNGLSQVYKFMGDYEKALVCIKKAILYKDADMSPAVYTDMATLYSLLGNYEMALAACRQYEENAEKLNIWFLDQKAECYVNLGQTEEAVEIYRSYFNQAKFASYRMQTIARAKGFKRSFALGILGSWSNDIRTPELKQQGLYFLLPQPMSRERADYYNAGGWMELMTGSQQDALDQFKKSLLYAYERMRENNAAARISDAVFAAAVCNCKRLGGRWAGRLKKYLNRKSWEPGNAYYEKEKAYLSYQLLAAYFTESEERIQELLDRETSCRICWHCTSPICRKIEGVRILFLIRTGHSQEAKERLKKNMAIQPADEYMLAIRHVIFEDKL